LIELGELEKQVSFVINFITIVLKLKKIIEKSSLWNVIYGASGVDNFELQDVIETLQQWPLEQINWPVQNSLRNDVRLSPYNDRR
jgi:hypothetical protein